MNRGVDFDTIVPRENTHAEKYDARVQKFGTEDVIPLWVADMDFVVSDAIQEALLKRVQHPIYGYTDYYDEYYSAIVRWMKKAHSWEIERAWIRAINSVVSGINVAIERLSDEGDGVIVQPPIYAPFYSSVTQHKRELLENELMVVDGAYTIDFDDFEAKAIEAKLFLLCSPHNPTGRVWSQEELNRLVTICKKYAVIIISDEVHADLVYGMRHIPIASIEGAEEITITLNSPAKSFNIMGSASPYAIVKNPLLRDKFYSYFEKYAIIHPNLFALSATIAAYTQSDNWLEELKLYLQKNLNYIHQRLESIPKIKAMPTEATFLVWLDCRALNLSHEKLERLFIKEAGLGLSTGVGFGRAGGGFMRLNFALPRVKLVEVMDRFEYFALYY